MSSFTFTSCMRRGTTIICDLILSLALVILSKLLVSVCTGISVKIPMIVILCLCYICIFVDLANGFTIIDNDN